MTVLADSYVVDSLERLRRDIRATGHIAQTDFVAQRASEVATFQDEPASFVQKVVDDVQQRFQDEFIDTTWPACPIHSNHPLDFGDGVWRCPTTSVVAARLGELEG